MSLVQDALAVLQNNERSKSPFLSLLEGVAGGVSTAQDKALQNAKVLIEMDDLRRKEEQERQKQMRLAQEDQIARATEQETQNNFKTVGIPGTSPDAAQRLNQIVTIETDPNTGYRRRSIKVVEPKEVSFQPATYKDESGRIRKGRFNPVTGDYIKRPDDPLAEPTSGGMNKPPAGYRWTATGGQEPIPGGPVDLKQKGIEEKEIGLRQAAINQADTVMTKVDQALANVGTFSAGLGSKLSVIPGTSARNLEKDIDTIKANLGFAALQEMRRNSPTGGALGQVAVQELTMLQSTVASLDPTQSPPQLKRNLEEVRKHYQNWKNAVMQSGSQVPGSEESGVSGGGSGAPKVGGTFNGQQILKVERVE